MKLICDLIVFVYAFYCLCQCETLQEAILSFTLMFAAIQLIGREIDKINKESL